MKIHISSVFAAEDSIRSSYADAESAEAACQSLAKAFYEQFTESLVMARTFIVMPYALQPPRNAEFARTIAKVVGEELVDSTPILTLMGTYGEEPDWCHRSNSKGHLAIPLFSSQAVKGIPMLRRLLVELGFDLKLLDGADIMNLSTVGKLSGLFYVRDAALAVDNEGSKIIPDQAFVKKYGVETVFGNGMMIDIRSFLVTLIFAREQVERRSAMNLLGLGAEAGILVADRKMRGALFQES